jgi:FKBP-type peptidyl-prolyl cis-trans isomerase
MRRLFCLTLVLCWVSPLLVQAQREKLPPRDLLQVERRWPNAVRTSTGLYTELLREGTGRKPVRGEVVSVLYTGWLLDGTIFDQNINPDDPFKFQLDRGRVIEGWEYALLHMHVGEKRLVIVPYEMAYGTKGRSPNIPRKATLVFEVELLGIQEQE